jgi:3-deoxy-D-manno-octulosonic-acid transferase
LLRSVIYVLYWTVQVLAFPFLLLYLALRVVKNRAYTRGLGERFGLLPHSFHRTAPGAVWLHAVSVGEVITAGNLIHRWRASAPWAPVYVSVSTLAGHAMAEQKLGGLAAGIFYAPIDYRFAVRRVLRALKPALVVVMETEIWPNLFRDARLAGARLLVVNGRISDKALPRYERFRWFFRAVLPWADTILAQDAIASERYRELGAAAVRDVGNLKYDFDPDSTQVAPAVAATLECWKPEHVWIAASTMPPAVPGDVDEDDLVLETFRDLAQRHPRLLLILVPRRPERFEEAAGKLAAAGVAFIRRSSLNERSIPALPCVLLVDTIGELSGLFRLADVVFMGGSMAQRGGHNVLEPAAFGVPIVVGPHMENFTSIAAEFCAGGALVETSAAALAATLDALLCDADRRAAVGARAKELSDRRRGATERALAEMTRLHARALPRPLHAWPRRLALTPLVWLWRTGMALDRGRKRAARQDAGVPVVSAGNLAMGGTGKTPFVIWLCRELGARGLRPAVLTRGYRRSSRETLALQPGEKANVEKTGEEAQLILRAGVAAVGIGADRMAAWRALQQRERYDIAILDDAFQHWRMARTLDIVLIDALDPFRGGVFPLGLLREPFSALKRADAIVLTRTQLGRSYEVLEAAIRNENQHAPIFHARIAAERPELPEGPVGAFCGIGNPESFRETLRELGIDPRIFEAFPDHHAYTEFELEALAGRVDVLLTTEKDFVKIDAGLARRLRIHPVPMRLEIDRAAELLRLFTGC